MKICILGSGNIGGTLAKKWAAAGHTIIFGARDVNDPKYQKLLQSIKGDASIAPAAQAVSEAEVVLFATPGKVVGQMAAALDHALAGKIIIDATNNVGQAELNSINALAAQVTSAQLFRAFNSLGWENFDTPSLAGTQIDLFYCGSAGEAQKKVDRLIADIGLRPIYVGDLSKLAVIDNLTKLWFALVFEGGYSRRTAFKLLSE